MLLQWAVWEPDELVTQLLRKIQRFLYNVEEYGPEG